MTDNIEQTQKFDWQIYLRVFLGLFALWYVAWGMWSWNIPYFSDDVPYFKLRQNVSLAQTIHNMFAGHQIGRAQV